MKGRNKSVRVVSGHSKYRCSFPGRTVGMTLLLSIQIGSGVHFRKASLGQGANLTTHPIHGQATRLLLHALMACTWQRCLCFNYCHCYC